MVNLTEIIDTNSRQVSSEANHNFELQKGRDRTRFYLALSIVIGYFILIFIICFSPLIIKNTIGLNKDKDTADNVINIINSYTSITTGVTSIVGFVLGYYFKEKEQTKEESI